MLSLQNECLWLALPPCRALSNSLGQHAGIFLGIVAGVGMYWFSPHEKCKGTAAFDSCA